MANRPAIQISNWIPVALPYPNGCKCPRDDGSGQSDPCTEATCGSKCWSQPGANGSTKYQCTKIGFKPSNMSADDVSRPTTVAALLSTVGSPNQDVFTRGSPSQFITVGYTVWNLASAEDNRCSCNRGKNTGCNLCGVDRNRCYSLLPIRWESEGGGVWKFTVLQSFFVCLVDRWDVISNQLYPWPNGEYIGDPRLGHSRMEDIGTVPYGSQVAWQFRRGNGWQSIPTSQL